MVLFGSWWYSELELESELLRRLMKDMVDML